MALKIVEVCHVSPPPETAAPVSVPLTFFDLQWLKHSPIHQIFFYQATQNLKEEILFSQLKQSLTITLQHFPIFAGHLIWPDLCPTPIVCYENGNYLALTLARSDADFRHLIGCEPHLVDESHTLSPIFAKESCSRIPILALQVTVFSNGEFCVGITAHHGFMDGNSCTAFLKTWASFSKFGENRQPSLCFDRNDRFSDLTNLYGSMWLENIDTIRNDLSPWEHVPPPGKLIGTFELNESKIKKLKDLLAGKGVSQVSSFVVAHAYALVCLAKAKNVDIDKAVLAANQADYRSRLSPPLPLAYFGNCVTPCSTILDTKTMLREDGFVFTAHAIRKGIDRCLNVGIGDAENWLKDMFEWKNDYTVISTAGSNRFGFYTVDFGWGRPVKVETTSIGGTGAISFSDGQDGTGIEIGLVLDKDEMEEFASLFEQGLRDI